MCVSDVFGPPRPTRAGERATGSRAWEGHPAVLFDVSDRFTDVRKGVDVVDETVETVETPSLLRSSLTSVGTSRKGTTGGVEVEGGVGGGRLRTGHTDTRNGATRVPLVTRPARDTHHPTPIVDPDHSPLSVKPPDPERGQSRVTGPSWTEDPSREDRNGFHDLKRV